MASFDDLVQQVSDLQDASDDNADTVSSISDELDDHEQRLGDVEGTSGELTFPLDQGTIDLITEIFPTDVVTLVAGTVDIIDQRISVGTPIIYSRATPGGTLGHLSITSQIAGKATITSTSNTETSDIYYQFIAG